VKPPGTERLKLIRDDPLSNFAFKFNLRRYIMKLLPHRYPFLLVDRILEIEVPPRQQ
jgi:hypothetical protein